MRLDTARFAASVVAATMIETVLDALRKRFASYNDVIAAIDDTQLGQKRTAQ